MKLNEEHPFSKGTIDRIGEGIRGRRELNEDEYLQVMTWFDSLNEAVITIALEEVKKFSQNENYPGEVYRIKPPIESSHRVKTDDTIADKLKRQGTKLSRVQDLAGCRLDIDCSLDCLSKISDVLKSRFDLEGAEVRNKNYLNDSQFGYRAIHLHLTTPAGRVELQLRTKAQAAWANLNEVIGDEFSRTHRYDKLPDDAPKNYRKLVEDAQIIAGYIQSIEEKKVAILRQIDNGTDGQGVNSDLHKLVRSDIDKLDEELVKLVKLMATQIKEKEWQ
ncbi:RelA/SpoT domain-containing protein [Corynebacterium rhinophilum]|uniref:RelA/SpoT domain-containing protein n=1 Tax=Corynebacterium rhinophilum TaxID=3050197 RepID=UPI00254F171E|nr:MULTISPECIES: RelA/SpoT domain-containing protein [unclassified Corynebacterium]MDK8646626.1 RelA/SpoT domain-containing protein [Corynebacterium sp. MSK082]MDK8699081.1 RelA/SpoT domain-containing protein [Corynebacterium sp. MSK192]